MLRHIMLSLLIVTIILYHTFYKNYFYAYIYTLIFSPYLYKCIISDGVSFIKNHIQKKKLEKKIYEQISFQDFSGIYDDISNECNICLEEFDDKEFVVLLPCGCLPLYHRHCIFEWIDKNPTCPTCRKELLS